MHGSGAVAVVAAATGLGCEGAGGAGAVEGNACTHADPCTGLAMSERKATKEIKAFLLLLTDILLQRYGERLNRKHLWYK